MTLKRYLGDDSRSSALEELAWGAPTILGLARVSAEAMGAPVPDLAKLPPESRAILYLARERGVFEIKATSHAFDAVERFLTVHVELDHERSIWLRVPGDAPQTMRWFEGFRRLCEHGLVVHHLQRDFSLSSAGFELARTIALDDVRSIVAQFGEDR